MTLSSLTPPIPSTTRLLKIADLVRFPDYLPTGDVRYELDRGILSISPPSEDARSVAATHILFELMLQGTKKGFGKTRGRVGIVIRRNPDTLRAPDASFITSESSPRRLTPEGYLEECPQLIVEVRSRINTIDELEFKVGEYLEAGAKIVWLIDPQSQSVRAYQANHQRITFGPKDTLTIPQLIPGFQVLVADLFVS